MVVSLGICPSIRFGQILKSSDEIRCRNGVLALPAKELRNLVLLYSEIEVHGPVASTWGCGDVRLGRGVASAVVVSIEIDVVVIVVVLWGQVDIITSSSGHFCRAKALNSLLKTPVVFSDPGCGLWVSVSVVIFLGAVLGSIHFDVFLCVFVLLEALYLP